MVALQKLWGNARFKGLPPLAKLLYCFLSQQPSITRLGKVEVDYGDLNLVLGNVTDVNAMVEVTEYLDLLVNTNFISYFNGEYLTAVIHDHWNSIPNNKTNIAKAYTEAKASRGDLRKIYGTIFSKSDFEPPMAFKIPTPEEVSAYALDKGYLVNGKEFVAHYEGLKWHNVKGKKLRSWKQTCLKVWCREENKLVKVKGAPKGYEYFFVEIENGDRITPESWKKGKPMHSNFVYAEMLRDKFEEG
jgi:hypothetical protein